MTLYEELSRIFQITKDANVAHLSCLQPTTFSEFVGAGNAFGCSSTPDEEIPERMIFINAGVSLVKFSRQGFQLVLCRQGASVDVATKMLSNNGYLVSVTDKVDEKDFLLYRRNYSDFNMYRHNDITVVIARRKVHLDYDRHIEDYKAEFANHNTAYPLLSQTLDKFVVPKGKRVPEFYIDGDLPVTDVGKFFTYGKDIKTSTLPKPLMPSTIGHLAQYIGMGVLDDTELNLEGRRYLIRGASVRAMDKNGGTTVTPQFTILDESGKVTRLTKPIQLVDFILENPFGLRDAIQAVMQPQYDMSIEPAWGNIYDTIKINDEELLKTQELVISALIELLLRQKHGFLLGSPSTGKTISSITIMYVLHLFTLYRKQEPELVESLCKRYGVKSSQLNGIKAGSLNLVYCPAILPMQWVNEFRKALGDNVVAELVERPSDLMTLSRMAKQNPNVLHVGVLTYEKLKLSDGIEYAITVRHDVAREPKKVKVKTIVNGKEVIEEKWIEWASTFRWKNGISVKSEVVGYNRIGYPIKKYEVDSSGDGITTYGADPITGNIIRDGKRDRINASRFSGKVTRRFIRGEYSSGEYIGLKVQRDGNNDVVMEKGKPKLAPTTRPINNPLFQQKRRDTSVKRDGKTVVVGGVFPKKGVTPTRPYKMELAAVIKRIDNIGMVVVDEAHRIKSGNSLAGVSVRKTFSKAQKVLLVTATFTGGTADSLFHLIYPFSRELREKYPYTGELEFARDFGNVDENGKVLSGIAPEALRFIIGSTVFVDLPDLGAVLPAFSERIHVVEMTEKQQAIYDTLTEKIQKYGASTQGDLTVWGMLWHCQATIPDQAWHDELVYHHRRRNKLGELEIKQTFTHKGLGDEIQPKELAMLEIVKQNLADGNRVIIFTNQTDTRSILNRISDLVKTVDGAKPFIMQSSVSPQKRLDYIMGHVNDGANVMICNPMLVVEGTNLVQFQTIIFLESHGSTTVMVQSSRRTLRLSQKSARVEVIYMAYKGTPQVTQLYYVAKKSAALRQLQGATPTTFDSGISGGDGYGSLAREYAKAISPAEVQSAFDANENYFGYAQSIFNTPNSRKQYQNKRPSIIDVEVEFDEEV